MAIRKTHGGLGSDVEPVTAVRLPKKVLGQIDRWRRAHGVKTRSEAIRRLVEQTLGGDAERRPTRKTAAKAAELAGRAIDQLADPTATEQEKARRKRRLVKGPREFRRDRKGHR